MTFAAHKLCTNQMTIKFLKNNGKFLFGWMTLFSIILVSQLMGAGEGYSNKEAAVTVVVEQENPVDEEAKSRFFPLMFFYSK